MIELVAKKSGAGVLPIREGSLSAAEVPPRVMHSIAPLKGGKLNAALKKAVGVGLPDIGKSTRKGDVEILWTARDQYFLVGAMPAELPAAVTDQSDAWCVVLLSGGDAGKVMARLCPVELDTLEEGDVVRSLIGHMSAIIVKRTQGFEIMVFRAFAKTLAHELRDVIVSVNAQATLPK